ncbi:MAG: hypothetical protein GC171_02970 [Terrimonas sp.]|nr:hypothetical protein [Terrimonas sp.]
MKKEYWINIKKVDNRLVIFLNGEVVWDSGIVHDDPDLDQFVEITDMLKEHPAYTSELIFEGFNDTYNSAKDDDLNPWHFSYRVFERNIDADGNIVSEVDIIIPYDEKHLSNPNMRAINNSYKIVMKNESFKVVGNSLSQQFYK